MDELMRSLWEKRSLPPSWLADRTPHEILFLFAPEEASGDIDRVTELHRVNHVIRSPAGEAPVTPDWLMPKVPRGEG